MKVAQYYPRALTGDGGMTRAVRRLSRTMQARGTATRIICDAGPHNAPAEEDVGWHPVRHRRVAGRVVPDADQLAAALRGADVLILNSAWTVHNLVAASVARRLEIPYVLSPRGAYDPRIRTRHRLAKDAWWIAGERRLVRDSLAVHVFFESERAHLERLGYNGRLIVAPNGVDVPGDICWDGGSGHTVLWLGRFDPEHKGLDLMVRAMHQIPAAERPRLQLRGPDWRRRKSSVVGLIARLGLDRWVTVAEPVHGSEKLQLMARAAAFAYPSRWEGFGNSLAEAASVGTPLLVTPYPLGRYLAARGGAVLAEASVSALADGLATVVSPASSSLGARARQVVTDEFSWNTVAGQWLDGIERALAGGSG